jgi:hypothetical protein
MQHNKEKKPKLCALNEMKNENKKNKKIAIRICACTSCRNACYGLRVFHATKGKRHHLIN